MYKELGMAWQVFKQSRNEKSVGMLYIYLHFWTIYLSGVCLALNLCYSYFTHHFGNKSLEGFYMWYGGTMMHDQV